MTWETRAERDRLVSRARHLAARGEGERATGLLEEAIALDPGHAMT